MKRILLPALLLIGFSSFAQKRTIAVIPEPVSIVEGNGFFLLPARISISATSGLQFAYRPLQERIEKATGKGVSVAYGGGHRLPLTW